MSEKLVCGVEFVGTDLLKEAVDNNRPYDVTIELTGHCLGSCIYCYSTSLKSSGSIMPRERVLKLIEESKQIGAIAITWQVETHSSTLTLS